MGVFLVCTDVWQSLAPSFCWRKCFPILYISHVFHGTGISTYMNRYIHASKYSGPMEHVPAFFNRIPNVGPGFFSPVAVKFARLILFSTNLKQQTNQKTSVLNKTLKKLSKFRSKQSTTCLKQPPTYKSYSPQKY